MDSVEWFEPFLTIPTKETTLTYDKDSHRTDDRIMKINCDLSRVCEVEDYVCEWYEKRYI